MRFKLSVEQVETGYGRRVIVALSHPESESSRRSPRSGFGQWEGNALTPPNRKGDQGHTTREIARRHQLHQLPDRGEHP